MLTISSGLMINCTFAFTNLGGQTGEVYTCHARVIFVGDTRIVTEINEEHHLVDKNSCDVQILNYNQTIGFTPRNVSSFFPNLQTLNANSISSSELRREDVEGFKDLRSLQFASNRLEELENDLFYNNHFLTVINIDNNPISHVGHNAFKQPNGLIFLRMFNAACISRSTLSRAQVESLLFDIIIKCPPTLQMTEDKIVNGSAFASRVETQIKSELEVLYSQLEAIEHQNNELEQRVADLEQITPPSPHRNY